MRNALMRFGVMLIASTVGCAAEREYAAEPPFPAGLSPAEAAVVAHDALRDRGANWGGPVAIHVAPQVGYVLHYDTPLELDRRPPREAHMLLVRHDGSIKDLTAE
jgi:hypothetical protein